MIVNCGGIRHQSNHHFGIDSIYEEAIAGNAVVLVVLVNSADSKFSTVQLSQQCFDKNKIHQQ